METQQHTTNDPQELRQEHAAQKADGSCAASDQEPARGKQEPACAVGSEPEPACGIRWTYGEVFRGKATTCFLVSFFVLVAAWVGTALWLSGVEVSTSSVVASVAKDILTLKAERFAQDLAMIVVILMPLMIVMWPVVALALTAALNLRDRKMPRTEVALRAHSIEASWSWTWVWSIAVGIIDFTAVFYVISQILQVAEPYILADAKAALTVVATVVCLVLAERRVQSTSRRMAARCKGNYELACMVLDGEVDWLLPEKKRNPIDRTKVATLIRLGIFRSPTVASAIVDGINLRTKVKLFSAFLNSAIHGIFSALSFGIAAVVANELGDVGGKYAEGKGDVLVARLRDRQVEKPHFVVEIVAFVLCIAWTAIEIAATVAALG